MGIVIAVSFARIELVNRRPAGLTFEEACNFAVLDGLHRRVSRRENVERLMSALAASAILERSHELIGCHSLDRHFQIAADQFFGRRCGHARLHAGRRDRGRWRRPARLGSWCIHSGQSIVDRDLRRWLNARDLTVLCNQHGDQCSPDDEAAGDAEG